MPGKSIAVIGAGYWGKNLVRNFHQRGVLKTVCDADAKIRQQWTKDYPDARIIGGKRIKIK
jgi:UDP-2-acetamido-3-amino-2,3-dideoxy-glucuronate N-acetyltransferase